MSSVIGREPPASIGPLTMSLKIESFEVNSGSIEAVREYVRIRASGATDGDGVINVRFSVTAATWEELTSDLNNTSDAGVEADRDD